MLLTTMALLAGCLGSAPAGLPPPSSPAAQAPPGLLPAVLALAAEDCGRDACYEPNIVADPAGRLFVTKVAGTHILVSGDEGRTWSSMPAPPMPGAAPQTRPGDSLVQVDGAGRLYYSAMAIASGAGRYGFQVASSDDGGATWASNVLVSPAHTPGTLAWDVDRQWLGFGADGEVYLSYNQVSGFVPLPGGGLLVSTGIWVARSDDGGRSFGPFVRAAPFEDRFSAGQHGPPLVLDRGRVLFPYFAWPGGVPGRHAALRLALSDDQGATWRHVEAFTDPSIAGSWFPVATADGAGRVHAAWWRGDGSVLVASSEDGGETWSEPARWSPEGDTADASPWVAAGAGRLRVAWFSAKEDGSARLTLASAPLDATTDPARVERVVVEEAAGGNERRPANSDFASLTLLPDGRAAVTWARDGIHVAVEGPAPPPRAP